MIEQTDKLEVLNRNGNSIIVVWEPIDELELIPGELIQVWHGPDPLVVEVERIVGNGFYGIVIEEYR